MLSSSNGTVGVSIWYQGWGKDWGAGHDQNIIKKRKKEKKGKKSRVNQVHGAVGVMSPRHEVWWVACTKNVNLKGGVYTGGQLEGEVEATVFLKTISRSPQQRSMRSQQRSLFLGIERPL